MTKPIEQKYKKLSDIDHVLLRPGMWVGSTKPCQEEMYLPEESGLFAKRGITYNPALLKIFDEIVSNSVDEHRRNKSLNELKVKVDPETYRITVWDNGGIPVEMHSEYNEWIPEMIFSSLKAGSNFDDSEERLVAGTNGVGSTLTNIFSTWFRVRTADGKKAFEQVFTDNMRSRSAAKIIDWKKGFTEISFDPDLSRFGLSSIDQDHLDLMRKRCINLAACNPDLTVWFNDTKYRFKSFKEYCALYGEGMVYEESGRWKIAITASGGSFEQVSFVNSVETKDGGTHVDHAISPVLEWIRTLLKRKHKVDLKPSELRNHLFAFVQCDVVNPSFSSQTKEKLITEARDFGSKCEPSDKFMKAVVAPEVIQRVLDWAQQKALADERKQLRELNKDISKGKVLKLIDAKSRVDRESCTLSLFEGDSASSAFRKYRNPMTQGAFPLRGKFINVTELPNTRVIQNQEVKDLLTAIGLKMGEEPKGLRYGKVLIYSDADPDGDSIAGLLMNFFGKYWPEMFEQGRICRVMTPLVVAKKGSETLSFYSNSDFEEWMGKVKDIKKWDIAYKKGLAALEDAEYREIIQSPKMFSISGGKELKPTLDTWFAGDSAPRKVKILGSGNEEPEASE
jgi:DNA topoisomerase-2